ncbi:MAG: outer membrane lipoprotein carrier protein LolA [Candidatus Omnitrophica bacterium]|nr:outer membrane lipoprotein carrier protein LolA [Candidatus Omnitrophota bacterium]
MRRKTVLLLAVFCLYFPVFLLSAVAEDLSAERLSAVSARMAGIRTVQADFVQEKRMRVFSSPVTLRGRLFLDKPELFSWHVFSPVRYSIVMRRDTLRLWDGQAGTTRTIGFREHPVVGVVFEQLKRWFCGDYAGLSADYAISVVREAPLTLFCVPHEGTPQAGMITGVQVQFQEDRRYIERITINEPGGDTTTIDFVGTRLNEPVPPEAWRVRVSVEDE